MKHRILLVEDEDNLSKTIRLNLEMEGYDVAQAYTGKEALEEFRSKKFDLVLLDVMLPEIDGFTVCQTIRLENTKIPVLFLTAKGAGDDRIAGLKMGADDYLVKPFNLEELLLRVQNLLKRNAVSTANTGTLNDVYEFGNNKINFITFEITGLDGEKYVLGKKEIMLLKLFTERKNEVISREQILQTVWGYDVYPSTRTIDNYILAFRKYFEKNPREPEYFHSIRGVGYKFKV